MNRALKEDLESVKADRKLIWQQVALLASELKLAKSNLELETAHLTQEVEFIRGKVDMAKRICRSTKHKDQIGDILRELLAITPDDKF
jgi:hypothetical protein